MFNINQYSESLTENDGIFFSKDIDKISYPSDGNEVCFNIEDKSFWFQHRNDCIISVIKKYAKDQLFFDIGGGNGYVTKGLQENGIQACLIEPGIQGCLNAKKRGITNLICSDLKNAGLKSDSILSAGLFDVIEHIENDMDFLRAINQCIVDAGNGYLFITVPAYQTLWSNEDIEAGHFRRYNMFSLKKKLHDVGFEIEYSTYIFSFLILPVLIFRTIPSLLCLNRRRIKKTVKEHQIDKKGVFSKLLSKILSFELRQIDKSRKIPFGGSCLIVAKKKKIR